eukprot:598112-Alexandrium_andersonii.AAC.1
MRPIKNACLRISPAPCGPTGLLSSVSGRPSATLSSVGHPESMAAEPSVRLGHAWIESKNSI